MKVGESQPIDMLLNILEQFQRAPGDPHSGM